MGVFLSVGLMRVGLRRDAARSGVGYFVVAGLFLRLAEQELADQLLEHHRRLRDLDAVAVARGSSSSPPASSPTYGSPSRPEVRIEAVVSLGNW